MRLVDYLALARERIVVVVGVLVLSIATVLAFNLVRDPEYAASVRVRARPAVPGSAASDFIDERQELADLGTEAQLVRSSSVAAAVAETTGFAGPPDDLLDQVRVDVVPNTAVLLVEARASDPDLAIVRANAFAEQYLETRRSAVTEAIDAEIGRQSARVQALLDRLVELDAAIGQLDPSAPTQSAALAERARVLTDLVAARSLLDALSDRAAIEAGFGEIIQPARTATTVRSTSLPRAGVFGALLGVPLSLAVVLLLDSLSNAIRSRADAERSARAPVLGAIPEDPAWSDPVVPRLVTIAGPFSPTAEAYRALGYTLDRLFRERDVRTVLVTSPGDGEGKTATVANLAVAGADAGRPCRVVDADLRNARLHAFFGAAPDPGLSDVLVGDTALADAVVPTGPGLDLLGSGRPTERPDLLLARADVPGVLDQLAAVEALHEPTARPLRASPNPVRRAEASGHMTVLVDSAPVLAAAEVSRLAATVDAVILVSRIKVTSKSALAAAAEQLRRAGGTLLGIVLVGTHAVPDAADVEFDPSRVPDVRTEVSPDRRPVPS